jgi:hypothetical protein
MRRALGCLLLAAAARAGDDPALEARVVDERTGKPVAGAEVRLHHEVEHPGPGPVAPVHTARTDADGRVRVARADLPPALRDDERPWDWAYVEAPGYAPNALYNSAAETRVVELRAPADVVVVVRDLLDRPVAGAQLSWILGCGHAPDARQAVTGADGAATLLGIQAEGTGQTWVVAEGLLSDYADGEPRAGRVRHTPGWALTVVGRVLTHEGKPAAGVAVGGRESHRGPWARTDLDGRFRLAGLVQEPGETIYIEPFDGRVPHARAEGPSYAVHAPPPDIPLVFRLPAPGAEHEPERPSARIVVDLRHENGMAPEEPLALLAVREADGLTFHGEVDPMEETGMAWIDVPAGAYAVLLRRLADSGAAVAERRGHAVAAAGAGAYVRMPPPRPLWVKVQRAPGLPEGVDASLVAEGWRYFLEPDDLDLAAPFVVPPDRPVFLRIEAEGEVALLPLRPAPEPGGAEVATIELPR